MGEFTVLHSRLLERVHDHSITVGIIGLGYVGLPLVRTFVASGFRTLGFDVDPTKVERLLAGDSYIGHIPSSWISECISKETFLPSADMSRLSEADVLLICVPIPLTADNEPALSSICSTGRQIAESLRAGQLVVLESTTYPGTTCDVLLPILESSGLTVGVDFYLAYSPEREDPGNREFETARIPKVVGGIDDVSLCLAKELYGSVVECVVPVCSCEAAEACKMLENTYRAVNIALVNELKVIFDHMKIDVWEVIGAAVTKPFGFQPFFPVQDWEVIACRPIHFISVGSRDVTARKATSSNWPEKSILGCHDTWSTASKGRYWKAVNQLCLHPWHRVQARRR